MLNRHWFTAAVAGATIGVAQSAGSLARILGPLFAATAYTYTPLLPYLTCGVIALFAGVIAAQKLRGAHGTASATAPVA